MKTKAVVYGRVSKDDDSQDYGRQLYELQEYAKRNDIEIVQEFTERISGTKEQRKQLNLMLDYVYKSGIKNILVTELSRFGRLGHKTRSQIEKLADDGINMFFKDKGLNTLKNGRRDDTNMMVIGILCDISEQELITLKSRIRSGLVYSASNNGGLSGKYNAYGFKTINKKLVIDEVESEVIDEIFNLYKNGLGTSQIARYLNSKGVPTRYNKVLGTKKVKTKSGSEKTGDSFSWSQGTIISILKNPLYKGLRIIKGEVVGNTTPIIRPELFDEVQLIIKHRKNRPAKIVNENPIKGIIKCGVCNSAYFMKKRKDGNDNAYQCLSNKLKYEGKAKYCGSPSINIDKLFHSLFVINSKIITKRLDVSSKKYLFEIKSKIEHTEIKVDNTKASLKRIIMKLENLYEDYNERVIEKPDYLKTKGKYQKEISKAESEIEELITELTDLKKIKKTSKIEFNTLDVFKKNIKEIVKLITIQPVRPKSKEDKSIRIRIKVKLIEGDIISYILSRYTNSITDIQHLFETEPSSNLKKFASSKAEGQRIEYDDIILS